MDLRHMRSLVALADEEHFTKAARHLRIAQPALSQQIRRLEEEVGLSLVERTTRSVRMTAAGELLVKHARRVLEEAELAHAVLDDLRGLRIGRLVVGASHTIGSVDLSRLLADFHRQYPGVELTVQEDVSVALAAALARDEIDLAFLTVTQRGGDLEARVVAEEPLVCILPPHDPRARRGPLDLLDVKNEPFVVFRQGATIRQRVDAASSDLGFTPRVLFETNNIGRMGSLVSAGLAIAVLPEYDAARLGTDVSSVPFRDPALIHTVYLTWRSDRHHSPASRAFSELVLSRTPSRSSSAAP